MNRIEIQAEIKWLNSYKDRLESEIEEIFEKKMELDTELCKKEIEVANLYDRLINLEILLTDSEDKYYEGH